MIDMAEGVIQELEDIKEAISDANELVDGRPDIDEATLRRLFYAIGKAEAVLHAFVCMSMKGGDGT